MGNQANSLPHTTAGGRIESAVRRAFAAVCIATLVCYGIYEAWQGRSQSAERLPALAALGAATAYTFGYFYCLPDVLGASAVKRQGTLRQRWSDFARLAAAVAIVGILIPSAIAVLPPWKNSDARENIEIIVCAFVTSSILAACVVASGKYLEGTMARVQLLRLRGWRASVRRIAGEWGEIVLKLFRARTALLLGSAMTLASLGLTVESAFFGSDYSGYEVVRGALNPRHNPKEPWSALVLKSVEPQFHRLLYVLTVVVATIALWGAVSGRSGNAIRRSRFLVILSGALALFFLVPGFLPDLLAFWHNLPSDPGEKVWFALWIVVWLVPIALWRRRASDGGERWERTRLSVMVFYLPILFLSLAWLVFLAPYILGYAFCSIGMLLVWWGLLQSQWEVAGPP